MWNGDNVLQVLGGSLGAAEVGALAKEVPCSLLLTCLDDADIRVARNAAWVLTHKPLSEIRMLPPDRLIDLALTTSDTSLRRLVLCLVEKLPMSQEGMRTDLTACAAHIPTWCASFRRPSALCSPSCTSLECGTR